MEAQASHQIQIQFLIILVHHHSEKNCKEIPREKKQEESIRKMIKKKESVTQIKKKKGV